MQNACEESPAARPSTPPLHIDVEGNQFWGIRGDQPIHIVLDDIGFSECTGITLHRVHGPAILRADGGEEWWLDGLLHRVGGPAVTQADGSQDWMQGGRYHREDGPALIDIGASVQEWHLRGQLHRDDGPAHIDSRLGYQHGQRHREDGPAVIRECDGVQEWWRHGVLIRRIEQ
jgi:hypothetical protein